MAEVPQKFVLYAVLTLIFILVGSAIFGGLNAQRLLGSFRQSFQPGKLFLADEQNLESKTIFGCTETFYTVFLDEPKFNYIPKGSEKKLDFVVVLTYNGIVFLGRDVMKNSEPILRCDLDNKEFVCTQDAKLEFKLQGIPTPAGTQILHFTMWQADSFVVDAIKQAESERRSNFADIINSYANFYLSSFDVKVDVGKKCAEANCRGREEGGCRATENCYWGGLFFNRCELCPSYGADCTKYTKDQCTQCPFPKASCKPTSILSFNGCETK